MMTLVYLPCSNVWITKVTLNAVPLSALSVLLLLDFLIAWEKILLIGFLQLNMCWLMQFVYRYCLLELIFHQYQAADSFTLIDLNDQFINGQVLHLFPASRFFMMGFCSTYMFLLLLFCLVKLSHLYIFATMQLVSSLRVDPEFNLIYFNPNAKVIPLFVEIFCVT